MLETSTIMNEVTKITQQGSKSVHYDYSVKFRMPDGSEVDPLKMVSLDIVRDFGSNVADVVILEVVFGMGTLTKKVYPWKTNIKAIIQRQYIGEVEDAVNPDGEVDTMTYTATLMDPRGHAKESSSPLLDTAELGDLGGVAKVQFQLVDAASEWLRSVATGGVFKNCTPLDVLQTILTKEAKEMPTERGVKIEVVDCVPADNTEKRNHIVVPHGTPLMALPSYLQDKCGGIYNSEIGFYLHQGSWYVWPLFNTQRFEDSPKGLTVINIPENRMPGIERTFRETANQLIIITTGGTRSIDTSNARQVNEGNGLRFTDAKSIFESFGATKDNITTLARGKNVTEILFKEAESGLNHVVQAAKQVSGNLMSALSKISSRKGQIVQTVWEHSKGSKIYPGMPVQYLYENDNTTKILFGVVTQVQDFIHLKGEGMSSRRFTSNSSLTLFLETDNDDES
ncbi:hypothetical protein D3C85_128140 [compost metagenome]